MGEIAPERIGKYAVEGVLGRGAMGVVYRAWDPAIQRRVAIKVIHRHLLEDDNGEQLRSRFQQEARAGARCVHPNIVTIFDFGTDGGLPFIVMELVDGRDLRSLLKAQGPFEVSRGLQVVTGVLEALEAAHREQVVHRDIKPANILIVGDRNVKVSDFGVARIDTSELTGTGMALGTPYYMPPESLRGETVDHRADLFSVGVLLLELLTGFRPIPNSDLGAPLAAVETANHLSPGERDALVKLLRIALQGNASQRFQTARHFIQALAGLQQGDATLVLTRTEEMNGSEQIRGIPEAATPEPEWSPDILQLLEKSLARFVGPMAGRLVQEDARSYDSLEELCTSLSRRIPSPEERQQFVSLVETSGARRAGDSSPSLGPGTSATHGRPDVPVASAAELARLSEQLLEFVGPMASRLVADAAGKTSNLQELYELLATSIPDLEERDSFLRKGPRRARSRR
ncbi:MAG: serine/threonine protein kinase [Gammaproteobacteria bacterium]|nr:serine/threonine protein kinase [Gammaproteobacteria bacterium]